MRITKLATALAVSSVLTLSVAGAAMADDVTIGTTGPGSTNTANVNNNSNFNMTNNNNVAVNNTNNQTAVSGPANVSGNTNAGSATSGNANNSNSTNTVISINNPAGGVGGGVVGTTGGTGGGTVSAAGGVGGGSLSSASTMKGGVGGGSLPNTGATDPVDISGLQSLFHPSSQAQNLAAQTQATSRALLAAGALLSLIGALGSAVYANKKRVNA